MDCDLEACVEGQCREDAVPKQDDQTPLLSHTSRRRTVSSWVTAPYLLLFISSILCNIVPFLPVPPDQRLFRLFLFEGIQRVLWLPIEPLLEGVSSRVLLDSSEEPNTQKTDTPNAVLKGFCLTILPTYFIILRNLHKSGLSIPCAAFLSFAEQALHGFITFKVFIPLAKRIGQLKTARNKKAYDPAPPMHFRCRC